MAQPTRQSTVHRELSKRRYRQRTVSAKHRDPHHDRRTQKHALQVRPEPEERVPDEPAPRQAPAEVPGD